MIVGILKDLNFRSTTHERNLHRGEIDDELVLICRQVDDFAVASVSRATASKLIAAINARVTTKDQGLGIRYNGIDLLRTRDCVKVSCETYLDRVLLTHGWDKPGFASRIAMIPSPSVRILPPLCLLSLAPLDGRLYRVTEYITSLPKSEGTVFSVIENLLR
jgi:hypothetical protein